MTSHDKVQILEHMKKVPTETIWGLGIQLFIERVQLKTDEDFERIISDLQSQIIDCSKHMKIVLGDTYEFFKNFQLQQCAA